MMEIIHAPAIDRLRVAFGFGVFPGGFGFGVLPCAFCASCAMAQFAGGLQVTFLTAQRVQAVANFFLPVWRSQSGHPPIQQGPHHSCNTGHHNSDTIE